MGGHLLVFGLIQLLRLDDLLLKVLDALEILLLPLLELLANLLDFVLIALFNVLYSVDLHFILLYGGLELRYFFILLPEFLLERVQAKLLVVDYPLVGVIELIVDERAAELLAALKLVRRLSSGSVQRKAWLVSGPVLGERLPCLVGREYLG